MPGIKVIITHKENFSTSPTMGLSQQLMKQLNIPNEVPLLLRCSNEASSITCYPIENVPHSKSHIVYINQTLAEQFHLINHCQHLPIYLSYHPLSQELTLGPIFAVLVGGLSRKNPPFSELNGFCQELLHIAEKKHTLAYIVTLKELAKGKNQVTGWTFQNHTWSKASFPRPQVVYNRISSRKIEKGKTYKDLLKHLVRNQIFLFNSSFLNKWDVFKKIGTSKSIANNLPQTALFSGPLTLKQMLQRYPVLFIKPIHGSMGRGIYRITKKVKDGTVYTVAEGPHYKHFNQISQLYSYLKKQIKNGNRYIIQEGIPILSLQNRPIDFRILMQKNKSGKWGVTSMVARIAAENLFVSNVAQGGEINRITSTLKKCGVPTPEKTRQQLLTIARHACTSLEEQHPGLFAELGVDLALTPTGRIYILEINSKPSKADNTLSLPHSKGRPSVHKLIDYTLFLTHH